MDYEGLKIVIVSHLCISLTKYNDYLRDKLYSLQRFIIFWWRRRELNPRPPIRRQWLYMLRSVFKFNS